MEDPKTTNIQNARMFQSRLESTLEFMASQSGSFSFPFTIHMEAAGLKLTGQITQVQPEATEIDPEAQDDSDD